MSEFERVFQRIEDLVDRVFDRSHLGYFSYSHWHPPMDVYETEQGYVVILDIAGVAREDLEITLHEGVLSIRGLRGDLSPERKIRCHQAELPQGQFERNIRLSPSVTEDSIEARMRDGLLTIEIAKERK